MVWGVDQRVVAMVGVGERAACGGMFQRRIFFSYVENTYPIEFLQQGKIEMCVHTHKFVRVHAQTNTHISPVPILVDEDASQKISGSKTITGINIPRHTVPTYI